MGNGEGKGRREVYISVDVETSGNNPSDYSMLSIGACLVEDPDRGFYIELQPVSDAFVDEAMAVSGLSMEELGRTGVPPVDALHRFGQWVQEQTPDGERPVFVAFNAPFDWMFVNDYFFRFLGRNPFGHSALDIKAYYMGMRGVAWSRTSIPDVSAHCGAGVTLSHNALDDARDQARLFACLLAEQRSKQGGQD